jgi:hypothetical protein
MLLRRIPAAIVALAFVLVPASPAVAQGGGVVVDPGGPSSKEYSLPTETARAAGSGKESDGNDTFGAGITPSGGRQGGNGASGSGAKTGTSRPSGTATSSQPTGTSGGETSEGVAQVRSTAAGARAADSSKTGWIVFAAILLALGLGIAAGVALRRSSARGAG